jgi:hypothetical protein
VKIRLCIPFYHEICSETAIGVRDCLKHKEIAWEVSSLQGPYIGTARNHLVNRGKSHQMYQNPDPDVDYFLFVDADIGFQFRHVAALIEHEVDIVSGAYLRQRDGKNLTAGKWARVAEFVTVGLADMEKCVTVHSPKALTRVDYVGGGFLLVRQKVFTKLPFPWFRELIVQKREVGEENPGFYQVGEDLGFCAQADTHDIPIHCDTRVTLFHKPRPRLDANRLFGK